MQHNWIRELPSDAKPIPDYEGLYCATADGKVFSIKGSRRSKFNPQSLTPRKVSLGYHGITLTKNGVRKQCLLHRIIAQTFIPNPENKPTVNHKDGNKQNNCVANLEWCTQKEQIKHAIETGLTTFKTGENARNVKLSNKAVSEIKWLLEKGFSQSTIAGLYEIHQSHVSNIKSGKKRANG